MSKELKKVVSLDSVVYFIELEKCLLRQEEENLVFDMLFTSDMSEIEKVRMTLRQNISKRNELLAVIKDSEI
ncbi:hypothetical protein [Vagococcus fluvialis]|uniref:hypothetical protein n=1 Tax=Vagococcus fluvialis TaxID=2738 RepID=UPI002B2AC426|nr:hypothetical protein QDW48_04750 [Vagococcus fluvialis]